MKEGLAQRLAATKTTTTVQVIESMRSLLLDKQSAPSTQRSNPLSLLNTFHHPYSGMATQLEAPLKLAQQLEEMKDGIKREEALLTGGANTKKTILADHQKEIEQLKVKLKKLETRNGELSKEIDNPPEKQREALQKKIEKCDKLIQSMTDLIPDVGDDDKHLGSIMKTINNTIIELESLKKQLQEIKFTNPKEEQVNVREQMTATKKLIDDMGKYSPENLLAMRKEKLEQTKKDMGKQKEALETSLVKLQKTPAITNEIRDLLVEGSKKLDYDLNPAKRSKTAPRK